MDAAILSEAIEYEQLTKATYEAILAKEGVQTIKVEHNVKVKGRSGVEHQIDVFWEFRQAGVTHRVLIECKNYASNLTLEKARNFFGVTHDIGNCVGIMVTKTGYQTGAADFCRFYGINMKLLRRPTAEDWAGRVKTLNVRMTARVPVSTEDKPIECELFLRPKDQSQEQRLVTAAANNPDLVGATPSLRFLGMDGEPREDELRWWLPRQLSVLDKVDGGPYKQEVPLDDHYVRADLGQGPELVQAIGAAITYYVETLGTEEFSCDAEQTVAEILRDFDTGDWEHVNRTR